MSEVSVDRAELVEALARLRHAVRDSSTVAAATYVLLRATADRLVLSCTNLEISAAVTVDPLTASGEPFAVALPLQRLRDTVGNMTDATVSFRLRNAEQITVRSGRSMAHLPFLEEDVFPQIDFEIVGQRSTIDPAEIIARVAGAAAGKDSYREMLTGVHIARSPNGEGTHYVATDGARLALVESPLPYAGDPATVTPTLFRIFDGIAAAEIGVNRKGDVVLSAANIVAVGQSIQGKYPEYAPFVQVAANAVTASFDVGEALSVTRMAATAFPSKATPVGHLVVARETAYLLSAVSDGGIYASEFAAKVRGDMRRRFLIVTLNLRYLYDCLATANDASIDVSFSNLIRSRANDDMTIGAGALVCTTPAGGWRYAVAPMSCPFDNEPFHWGMYGIFQPDAEDA